MLKHVKVKKAKRVYEKGLPVLLVPAKCSTNDKSCHSIDNGNHQEFETMVRLFKKVNCNHDTGSEIKFYVNEDE